MKRLFSALLCVIMLLCSAVSFAGEANLISNGSFEEADSNGYPTGWSASAYRTQIGYTVMQVTNEKAHSGKYSAMIENIGENDARFIYTAAVLPSSMYKLSGWIYVESMEDGGNGANLALENIICVSDEITEPTDEWRLIEWYGETASDQTSITFGVRLGGYGNESVGKAYFDDITLEKVDALPIGVYADLWYSEYASSGNNESSSTESAIPQNVSLIVVLALVFLGFCFLVKKTLADNGKHNTIFFFILLVASFIVRVILALSCEGYSVDISCFTAWSTRVASIGPTNFYVQDYFCDYPPGCILLLMPVGFLLNLIGTDSSVSMLILKMWPIMADMAAAGLVYIICAREKKYSIGFVLSAIYLLNPAVLVTGAAWGQMDSVLTLLLMITAMFAKDRKWHIAIPVYVFAVLVKPQALLVGPVGLMWLICSLTFNAKELTAQLKQTAIGIGVSIAVAAIILIPFMIGKENPIGWLLSLYGDTLSSYNYAVLNTANLYFLAGANWAPANTTAKAIAVILPAVLFICAAVLILLKKCSRRNYVIAGFSGVVGIVLLIGYICKMSYAHMGYGLLATVYLFVLYIMFTDRQKDIAFYMSIALIGIFMLAIKVHERYMFPAILLLIYSYITSKDKRVLAVCVGYSITSFINTAIILNNSILYGSSYGHLNNDTSFLNIILCVVNLLLLLYSFYIAVSGLEEKELTAVKTSKDEEKQNINLKYRDKILKTVSPALKLCKIDAFIMLGVALVYAVVAFWNLGSTVAPQTAWVSTSADEQVVLDLGKQETFSLLYYCGVSHDDFSVNISDDGVNWSEDIPLEMSEGQCYRWKYALEFSYEDGDVVYSSDSIDEVLWLTGRYIRVNACKVGLNLWEIVPRDEDGKNLKCTVVDHTGYRQDSYNSIHYPCENIVDETNTCQGEPGWFTGTYFDEIYHARTAYEHLHGQSPYETTHPPLGKLLMALGISFFGMTPFGWRFMGTLFGVIILPVIYLLAMQITRKRAAAIVSIGAFALDFMHYTQTRIATIDTFPVFFIMLSYLFMVRYMQTDFYTMYGDTIKVMDRNYIKTLIPLALSGLFMGLSIASKWIGIYSAFGLAILFFVCLYQQYMASIMANSIHSSQDDSDNRLKVARNVVLPRILITCGFCVIFFIVIPAITYYVSYIPYFAPSGGITLKKLIAAQEGMLSYHSIAGLGMDHPFQSPWWQWPFIMKPMWYAQDHYEAKGMESTIMCMGNPWVYYIGAFAMVSILVILVIYCCRKKAVSRLVNEEDDQRTLLVIVIGMLAQYLPWVLVPRSMYIYHYFSSVPFIIMATAWWITRIRDRKKQIIVITIYLLFALAFFVLFFPYASGLETSRSWMDQLRTWFATFKFLPGMKSYFNIWY